MALVCEFGLADGLWKSGYACMEKKMSIKGLTAENISGKLERRENVM